MNSYIEIVIAKDFSDSPGARAYEDGPNSGEEFYEKILHPKFLEAKSQHKQLFIDLDGLWGWPSSFVSGSFGKLSQEYGAKQVLSILEFKSNDNPLRIKKAKSEIRNPDQNTQLAGG